MRSLAAICIALFAATAFSVTGQGQHPDRRPETVPVEIRGDWTVARNLSEHSLGCFDAADADALVGLRLSIGTRRLLWRKTTSGDLDPKTSIISSYVFLYRYGKLPAELGLSSAPVTIVVVHPSEGIPINALIRIDRSTILINACNIWLQATRDATDPLPVPR